MTRLQNQQTAAGPRAQPFQAPQGDLAVLAGSGNPRLAKAVARELGVRLSPCRAHVFSEGNVFVQIQENVRGRDTFIIQGVHQPVNDNFVELLFWIDALKRASAQQVTAVIPFFSYAKGDKKDEPRVSIRARVCADALEAAGADRVTVALPPRARVGDLRAALAADYPTLAPLAPNLLVAVGTEYADDRSLLSPDLEVACFPPVSGG